MVNQQPKIVENRDQKKIKKYHPLLFKTGGKLAERANLFDYPMGFRLRGGDDGRKGRLGFVLPVK